MKNPIEKLRLQFADDQIKDIGDLGEEYEPYRGKYFVFSSGRVWSLHKRDFLKPYPNRDGYYIIDLRDGEDTCRKQCRLHRLVAEAFIPNPDNLPTVNHENEDKSKNDVSNLSWMSVGDNVRYGTGSERSAAKRRKPVRCVETGEIYPSIGEAAKAIEGNSPYFSQVIKNNQLYKGYHWELVKEN